MNKGAALLISVLILTTILLGFALVGSQTFLSETSALTALENKKKADALANACAEEALYRLGINASYAGNETISIGTGTCAVRPVIVGGGTWTIETEASYQNLTSRLRVIISSRSPITITSWTSITAF